MYYGVVPYIHAETGQQIRSKRLSSYFIVFQQLNLVFFCLISVNFNNYIRVHKVILENYQIKYDVPSTMYPEMLYIYIDYDV